MAPSFVFTIFLVWLNFSTIVIAFHNHHFCLPLKANRLDQGNNAITSRNDRSIKSFVHMMNGESPEQKEKSRVKITVKGEHATNAVFRAEVQKELTFYRGCPAYFADSTADSAVIVTEGRTKQLHSFISWLKYFETDLVKRKPNFQGPQLMIFLQDVQWQEFVGDLKGFSTASNAPELSSIAGIEYALDANGERKSTIEARSMTGTDESV